MSHLGSNRAPPEVESLLLTCSSTPSSHSLASWGQAEALHLWWVPDGISVTRLRVPVGPVVSPRPAAHLPQWPRGPWAQALSEGSMCGGEDKNVVTHVLCRAVHSCSGGTWSRAGSCHLHFVRVTPNLGSHMGRAEARDWAVGRQTWAEAYCPLVLGSLQSTLALFLLVLLV